jgi:hypothetical protein
MRSCDRATEFKQRCQGLGITGVTLLGMAGNQRGEALLLRKTVG